MTYLKKALGYPIYGFTKALSFILDLIISVVAWTVALVQALARGLLALISLGGCLLLFLFFGPFGFFYLFHPVTIAVILFFIIFPILGTKFVSLIRYLKYMMTEFLFDLADYLIRGKDMAYTSFYEYGHQYKKEEEAKREEARRRRQAEQERQWEARFRQWQKFQQEAGHQQGYYQGYQGQGYQRARQNPAIEFKKTYEEACDLLGVPYDADIYQIKLAYRKKAKEYHPDVNKAENATELFQKLGRAYEFLGPANLARYKELH